jgi:type 1 glutamine amidotransferase
MYCNTTIISKLMLFKKQGNLMLAILSLFAFLLDSADAVAKDSPKIINQKTIKIKRKPRIVFLITKDTLNYEADKTIPQFSEMLKKKYGYHVSVLLGSGKHGSYRYPNMELVLKADLLVVFARRIALPHEQMNIIKKYLSKGKPLIGIRTANHAFTVWDKVEDGFEEWPGFVADILGCANRGYAGPGIDVSVEPIDHPIVKDIGPVQWHSKGNAYLIAPLLDKEACILLTSKINDTIQPLAWTRSAGKSRIFYTSLGYPTDFETPQFIALLVSAIKWTLTGARD